MSLQVRVAVDKKHELVSGPDDADIVVTVAAVDASIDPSIAYMQGKLKATGNTGALFDAMRSGEIAEALAALTA